MFLSAYLLEQQLVLDDSESNDEHLYKRRPGEKEREWYRRVATTFLLRLCSKSFMSLIEWELTFQNR
jgi:hypothetical protein